MAEGQLAEVHNGIDGAVRILRAGADQRNGVGVDGPRHGLDVGLARLAVLRNFAELAGGRR